MLGVKTTLAYAAIVLALVVSTGTSEDIEPETDEFELADDADDVIDFKDLEPDYQELLINLQRARAASAQDLDNKRMSSGWKRAQGAAGWKRAQGAAGWKRTQGASGWKRAQGAAGWKRAQSASGWKRDSPVSMETRGDGNWRNSNVKSASAGWKRTSRSANKQQRIEDVN
uniref:OvnpX n=1 Tax=Ophionotus victoriae TaxID=667017 RepID=A0A220W0E8_9ECHI|nr:OvnpX precursor [Ophionotus victoriae]